MVLNVALIESTSGGRTYGRSSLPRRFHVEPLADSRGRHWDVAVNHDGLGLGVTLSRSMGVFAGVIHAYPLNPSCT